MNTTLHSYASPSCPPRVTVVVVAEIRVILLSSLRSAVLWRQLGGSYRDFAFRRRAMQEAIKAQLEA